MPLSLKAAPHGANDVVTSCPWSFRNQKVVVSPEDHLQCACKSESKQCSSLLQSHSFDPAAHIYPSSNGFVETVIRAYSGHHHLVIRPEDIWFAIISQLSLYINAHAEELRHQFVAHEGKKELKVVLCGNRWSVDYGVFAKLMTLKVEENVVDPELASWVMPDFTTTTDKDRVVASVLLMGAVQSYFKFVCQILCGIPSVTLLGEQADWELLLARLDKLLTFGDEPRQWYSLLKPVLTRFVQSFKDPTSEEVVSFWQRVAHVQAGGSGPTWYSGWITAFCFWDEHGKSKYETFQRGDDVSDMSRDPWKKSRYPTLVLDGAIYHRVDSTKVPPGYSSVPVLIDDNGLEVPSMMVAGSVGTGCSSSGGQLEKGGTGLDTVQPMAGWWMFEKKSEEQLDEEERAQTRARDIIMDDDHVSRAVPKKKMMDKVNEYLSGVR